MTTTPRHPLTIAEVFEVWQRTRKRYRAALRAYSDAEGRFFSDRTDEAASDAAADAERSKNVTEDVISRLEDRIIGAPASSLLDVILKLRVATAETSGRDEGAALRAVLADLERLAARVPGG